ncbi:MAG: GxxExxY protein [Deltaproteobacteria bacterium]|nr:GxxExxY protein [Deltaproteobacteria bacterium]
MDEKGYEEEFEELNEVENDDDEQEGEERRDLSYYVVGAAIEVHNAIGPGFDVNTYKRAVAEEFKIREMKAEFDLEVPVLFKGIEIGRQHLDCVVDDQLVVEFAAQERLAAEEKSRAMAYLRGIEHEQGVLLNFGGHRLEFVRVPHHRHNRRDEEPDF